MNDEQDERFDPAESVRITQLVVTAAPDNVLELTLAEEDNTVRGFDVATDWQELRRKVGEFIDHWERREAERLGRPFRQVLADETYHSVRCPGCGEIHSKTDLATDKGFCRKCGTLIDFERLLRCQSCKGTFNVPKGFECPHCGSLCTEFAEV